MIVDRLARDWEKIEAEYRAGCLSIREIGRQHGVVDSAIVKRAKKFGWTRDLSGHVRQTAKIGLVRDAAESGLASMAASGSDSGSVAAAAPVPAKGARQRATTSLERETVEAAAARVIQVVRSHRRALAENVDRQERLSAKLDALIDSASTLDRLEVAQRIMESVARTWSRIIPCERQAFDVDGSRAEAPDVITKEQRDAVTRAAMDADA